MSSLSQATKHAVILSPFITEMPFINSNPLGEKRGFWLPVSFNSLAPWGQITWHFTEIKSPRSISHHQSLEGLGGHSSQETDEQKCFSLGKTTPAWQEALLALKNWKLHFRPCQSESESKGMWMEGQMLWLFPAWLTASKLLAGLYGTEHPLALKCLCQLLPVPGGMC